MPQLSRQEHLLDREMHQAFVQVHGADGRVPSDAIYDIRRRRQFPWRCLGRRIREMKATEVSKEQAIEIVRVLELFVDRIYSDGAA